MHNIKTVTRAKEARKAEKPIFNSENPAGNIRSEAVQPKSKPTFFRKASTTNPTQTSNKSVQIEFEKDTIGKSVCHLYPEVTENDVI